jgi:hypothetical protein
VFLLPCRAFLNFCRKYPKEGQAESQIEVIFIADKIGLPHPSAPFLKLHPFPFILYL